jgi:hypothetical protein
MSQAIKDLGDIVSSWVANSVVKSQTDVTVENLYRKDINDFVFMAGDDEMLRISQDGFWVRGQRLEQDHGEAETVYRSFRKWLVWAQLNRD